MDMNFKSFFSKMDQQRIVFGIAALLFVIFGLFLDGFAAPGNLLSLLRSVSIIGILGIGMAVAIIGRGIDLSMIAVMVMPVAWAFLMISGGSSVTAAFLSAIVVAICVGLLNGWLVAYVEVPAIFTTLATGMTVFGVMQFFAVRNDIVQVPDVLDIPSKVVRENILGIPNSVVFFGIIAAAAALFLRYTKYGRYIYAIGDNPVAARTTGVPVRPIIVLQYLVSALIALIAGFVLAATVESTNTRLFNSTMIYDVILVVVLGGVGLSGGKGGISNMLVGAVLIAILINGMTIMGLAVTTQNLIKAVILLLAIIADSLLNPRDEQTSQQGDI